MLGIMNYNYMYLPCEVETGEDSNESLEEGAQGTSQLELLRALGVEELNAE